MVISYNSIHKIKFPVYILPSNNWHSADGLLYVDNQLVDDRNVPEASLGMRRLKTPFKNLLPLKKSVKDLVGILKQPTNAFIDYYGTPFLYEKTKMVSVKYLRIKKITKKGSVSVLHLHGLKTTFIIPRPPPEDMHWTGVLYLQGYPWRLYEYSPTCKPQARRKV